MGEESVGGGKKMNWVVRYQPETVQSLRGKKGRSGGLEYVESLRCALLTDMAQRDFPTALLKHGQS